MATVTFLSADQAGSTVQLERLDADIRRCQAISLGSQVQAHTEPALALTHSSDGRLVASAGNDGMVRVWDIAARQSVGRPVRLPGDSYVLAFILAGMGNGDDRSVVLWDVGGRQRLGSLFGHLAAAREVVFSGDGRNLVTIGEDGNLIFWNLNSASWEAKACMLAGRNLTKAEWDQLLGGDYRRTCPQWPSG
jgi:WD40 repeat protein